MVPECPSVRYLLLQLVGPANGESRSADLPQLLLQGDETM